jgi:peptidoglycan-associated lipoprotein
MRSRILILSFLPIALLTAVGCSHRQKATTAPAAAPPAAAATTPAPAAPMPAASPKPSEPAAAPDPLSGDLAAVNAYLERQGFLTDVHFAFDQASLTEQGRDQLTRGSQFLRQHPQFVVTLEGNCDERGTAEYNLALGEKRAFTTRDYLSALGVDKAHLQTISYGKEKPVCTDETESCWSENRRVHPVVTGRSGG